MLSFDDLKISDLAELKVIFKDSFDDESNIHINSTDGPAGYADGSLLRDYVLDDAIISKKILKDNKIIGCYAIEKNFTSYHLQLLFIDPKYKDAGIGAKVWKHIEEYYSRAQKWYVEIYDFSERNKHFYMDKCGFHFVRDKICANGRKKVILMKEMSESSDR